MADSATTSTPAAAAVSDTAPTTTVDPSYDQGGHIEADDDIPEEAGAGDADSAYGASVAGTSTTSLASSVLRYRQENGRTYHAHKDGAYMLPNDDREQDRLDLQHNLFLLTQNNRLQLAPLPAKGVKNVLDVGTGTGIWAIDFADEHPEAHIIGVDLSPIQPNFVPPNVVFQVDDLEDDWTFTEKFDYIYSRMMISSFANWPRFFDQALENLEPGGILEMADAQPITSDDGTLTKESALHTWMDTLLEGSAKIGRPGDSGRYYRAQMEAAGFVNIQQRMYKWPQNSWAKDRKMKELGTWNLENMESGLHGLSSAVFTRILGWSPEALESFLVQVRKDMRDPKIHSYWPVIVVWGEKPKST